MLARGLSGALHVPFALPVDPGQPLGAVFSGGEEIGQAFLVQDRMFTPVPSYSRMTHLFMVSGWAADDCGTTSPCPTNPNNPDYPTEYRMSVVIAYNYYDPVHYRGAGIFLHVNGPGATAGCVSAPSWFMHVVMNELDPTRHPVIAIGR